MHTYLSNFKLISFNFEGSFELRRLVSNFKLVQFPTTCMPPVLVLGSWIGYYLVVANQVLLKTQFQGQNLNGFIRFGKWVGTFKSLSAILLKQNYLPWILSRLYGMRNAQFSVFNFHLTDFINPLRGKHHLISLINSFTADKIFSTSWKK